MSSVLERPPAPPQRRQLTVPASVRRVGHTVAAGINLVLLWVAHQLLDWGWPGFLTRDFDQVLGVVTASLIASIVVNLALALVLHHHGRFRAFTDLVTAAFALAVGVRMWEVFPFDFSGHDHDWATLLQVALVAGVVACGIAILANLVKLLVGPDAHA